MSTKSVYYVCVYTSEFKDLYYIILLYVYIKDRNYLRSAIFPEYKGFILYTCAYNVTIFNRVKCNKLALYNNNTIRANLCWLNNKNNNTIWYYYFTTLRTYIRKNKYPLRRWFLSHPYICGYYSTPSVTYNFTTP